MELVIRNENMESGVSRMNKGLVSIPQALSMYLYT